MQAVILAAGYARRMLPLSKDTHKSLLTVGGETVLGRMLRCLLKVGVTRVCLVTGYRADEIETYAATHFPQIAFTFVRNTSFATTNNIYSLHLALESIDLSEDLLLIESDLIVDDHVLSLATDSPHENVALVSPYVAGLDGTVVLLDEAAHITSVVTSSGQSAEFDFSKTYKTLNIYKFSSELCRTTLRQLLKFYVETIDANAYYELVLGILIYLKRVDVRAAVVEPYAWAEIDDPNDLRDAEWIFNPAARRRLLDGAWGGMWTVPVVDFAFLRNMYFPSPDMLSELRRNLPALLFNYGSTQSIVDAKMSYFVGCAKERIVALNGACQFFPILSDLMRGKRALVPEPTFGEYARTLPSADCYRDDFSFPLEELAARARDYDLVVVVNPNNPTGTVASTNALLDLARENPKTTFLIDESFIAFSDQPSAIDAMEQAPGLHANVVVMQSLSKSLGVPGARLGFLYGDHPWLSAARDRLPVWNTNAIAENFLEIVLKHRPELAASLVRTKADRDQLVSQLSAVPQVRRVVSGGANFVLAELDLPRPDGSAIVDHLTDRFRIYVRDVSEKLASDKTWLRLAVRTPAEHVQLCDAIRDVAGTARAARGALVSVRARKSIPPKSPLAR